MKGIHKGSFDDLLRMFGFDKNKVIGEVEKVIGRKLNRPNQE